MPVTPVCRDRRLEARLVGPEIAADHLVARLQRFGVDADALDGAGCRALARGNLRAFEGRARGRGTGEQPRLGAQHDFGIGADIDGEHDLVLLVRRFRQHHARRIGPHMARDAGQHIGPGAGIELQVQLARRAGDGKARWPAQRARRPVRSGRCRGTGDA